MTEETEQEVTDMDRSAAKLKGMTHLVSFLDGTYLFVDANYKWKDTTTQNYLDIELNNLKGMTMSMTTTKPAVRPDKPVMYFGQYQIRKEEIIWIEEL